MNESLENGIKQMAGATMIVVLALTGMAVSSALFLKWIEVSKMIMQQL